MYKRRSKLSICLKMFKFKMKIIFYYKYKLIRLLRDTTYSNIKIMIINVQYYTLSTLLCNVKQCELCQKLTSKRKTHFTILQKLLQILFYTEVYKNQFIRNNLKNDYL